MDFNDPYIDFTMLAQSLGVPGQRIENPGELRGALEQSLTTPGP